MVVVSEAPWKFLQVALRKTVTSLSSVVPGIYTSKAQHGVTNEDSNARPCWPVHVPLPRDHWYWRKRLEHLQQQAVDQRLALARMAGSLRHARIANADWDGGGDMRPQCYPRCSVACA